MTIRTEKISSNNNVSESLSVENQVEGAKKRGGHLLQAPGPIGYPVEYGGLTMLITQLLFRVAFVLPDTSRHRDVC